MSCFGGLGFFGFLRAGVFTVNGPFDPALHLTLADVQVESPTYPQNLRVFIKCSKTNPFRQGCFIFHGRGSFPTSSPGSSRFSIWRQLRRRPWHTADHVTKISNEDGDWRSEKIWVRDMAEVKINKMAERAELQFKEKKRKKDKFCM